MELKTRISLDEQRKIYMEEIYPIALEIRRTIVKDDEVILNSFKTLEQLGIILLRFPSKSNNLSGFHIKKSNIDCIYINSNVSLGRQYFSCWHEYYHAVTGEGSGVSLFDKIGTDKIECKADLFAGYILMPENLVEQYVSLNNICLNNLRFDDIIIMQQYFNVSYKAVIKRLQIIYGRLNNESELYSLSSKEKPFELSNYTISMGYPTDLINKTNDVYIPQKFLNDLEMNLNNNRINSEKKKSVEDFLEGIKNATKR